MINNLMILKRRFLDISICTINKIMMKTIIILEYNNKKIINLFNNIWIEKEPRVNKKDINSKKLNKIIKIRIDFQLIISKKIANPISMIKCKLKKIKWFHLMNMII